MTAILLIVFLIELIALGFLIYEINIYSQLLAAQAASAKAFLELKEAQINEQINAVKAYVVDLEKKINDKFGPYL